MNLRKLLLWLESYMFMGVQGISPLAFTSAGPEQKNMSGERERDKPLPGLVIPDKVFHARWTLTNFLLVSTQTQYWHILGTIYWFILFSIQLSPGGTLWPLLYYFHLKYMYIYFFLSDMIMENPDWNVIRLLTLDFSAAQDKQDASLAISQL